MRGGDEQAAAGSTTEVHSWINDSLSNYSKDGVGKETSSSERRARMLRSTSSSVARRYPSRVHQFINDAKSFEDTSSSWRWKAWLVLENPSTNSIALTVHYVYNFLILLSVVTIIVQSIDTLDEDVKDVLAKCELFFNTLYTVEVLARVICAPQKSMLFRSMYMWMDFGAILSFYVVAVSQIDSLKDNMYIELVALLIPILRMLKITRHSTGWRILIQSVKDCAEPLCVPLFLLVLMTVITSCVIFWLEKHFACSGPGCPTGELRVLESIPHAMWFVLCTISTVGYGDVVPKSTIAKFASFGLIIGGVCYMAMPLAIIGGTFVSVWNERDWLMMREKTKRRFREGGIRKKDLRLLFNATDEDNNGTVTLSEFIELVEAFKLGMTRAEIVKLFKNVDKNSSGAINFFEFSLFLFPEVDVSAEDCESDDEDYPTQSRSRGNLRKSASLLSLQDTFSKTLTRADSSVSKAARQPPLRLLSGFFGGKMSTRSSRHEESKSRRTSWATEGRSSVVTEVAATFRDPPMSDLGHLPAGPPPLPGELVPAPECSDQQLMSVQASMSLRDRMDHLESTVERLAVEQRQNFEAQQKILEEIMANVTSKGTRRSCSTRLPSLVLSHSEALPGMLSLDD